MAEDSESGVQYNVDLATRSPLQRGRPCNAVALATRLPASWTARGRSCRLRGSSWYPRFIGFSHTLCHL
jgi:hypothetical protein